MRRGLVALILLLLAAGGTAGASSMVQSGPVKQAKAARLSPTVAAPVRTAAPVPHDLLLDRTNALDRLVAFLEDPRVELCVGLAAGSCAIIELLQDIERIGAHHAIVLVTFLHALKALSSVIKESRTVFKGVSRHYHKRFHN